MATKKRSVSSNEIVDISAAIAEVGRNNKDLELQIQKTLSMGQKLSRGMAKEFKKIQERITVSARDHSKELDNLTKKTGILTKAEKERISTLKNLLEEERTQLEVLDRIADQNEQVSNSTKALEGAFKGLAIGLGIASAAIGVLGKAIDGVTFLYKNWFDLQQRQQTALASLAMGAGGTAQQLEESMAQVDRFRDSIGDLTQDVDGFVATAALINPVQTSFRNLNELTDETTLGLMTAIRAFGMGGEEANVLFRAVTTGAEDAGAEFENFVVRTRQFAQDIGAPANVIMRDYAQASSNIAEFGRDGEDTFRRAAQMANRFGFETQKIFEMVKGFDTFQKASQNVNTLNAMFGTSLSSFEMMMTQDPTERLEMLRESIMQTGQAWDDMNRFQRMQIAETLGTSVEEAARMFRDNISFEDLEAKRQEAEAARRRQEEIEKSNAEDLHSILASSREVVEDFWRALQRIGNILSESLAPIFEIIHDEIIGVGVSLEEWIEAWANSAEAQESVRNIAVEIKNLFKATAEELDTWDWEAIKEGFGDVWDVIKLIGSAIAGVASTITGLIQDVKDFGRIMAAISEGDWAAVGEMTAERMEDGGLIGETVLGLTGPGQLGLTEERRAGIAEAARENNLGDSLGRGLDYGVYGGMGAEVMRDARARETWSTKGDSNKEPSRRETAPTLRRTLESDPRLTPIERELINNITLNIDGEVLTRVLAQRSARAGAGNR